MSILARLANHSSIEELAIFVKPELLNNRPDVHAVLFAYGTYSGKAHVPQSQRLQVAKAALAQIEALGGVYIDLEHVAKSSFCAAVSKDATCPIH